MLLGQTLSVLLLCLGMLTSVVASVEKEIRTGFCSDDSSVVAMAAIACLDDGSDAVLMPIRQDQRQTPTRRHSIERRVRLLKWGVTLPRAGGARSGGYQGEERLHDRPYESGAG